jgi:hypothetical protein
VVARGSVMFGLTARKTAIAGIGILGAATTLFFLIKYHRYINVALEALGRTLLFSIVLVSSGLAGTHLYFGGQLSMLVDRMTILSDLGFYSLAVGFCLVPLAIYRAVDRAIKQLEKEEDKKKKIAASSHQDTPAEQSTKEQSKWERMSKAARSGLAIIQRAFSSVGETKPAALARRALSTVAPKELPKKLGKRAGFIAIVPPALLAVVATVSHLGPPIALIFLVLASVMAGAARKRTVAARLMLASVFGIAFGLGHGVHLSEVASTARVHLTSQGEVVHGTVLMNAGSGAIVIKPNKQLVLIPWSLIRTIEIAPGPSLASRMAELNVQGTRAAQLLRETASTFADRVK